MILLKSLIMIVLTIVMYIGSKKLQQKFKHPFLNPALISSIGIITILLLFNIDYQGYMVGGQWINYLLNCTVVCLAFSLYQNCHKILRHDYIIFTIIISSFFLLFIFFFYLLIYIFY